jgi:DNA-binding SARP family transcriptional activator
MCLRLVALCRDHQQYRRAEDWCEFLLARDPLDEAALQELLKVWRHLNRRVEAARRYREFERRLREDLGVAPDPETTSLLGQIEVVAA